ncbi:MAG: calcium-translocating P-type ATPase, PMCA-type [Prevotellaceae bacterium]|jgi:Ca2+-transporting ATPase|nr:calcium-translocating P-type ATPase, PMCA-type [Prevotellaceae bacterium]
MNYKGLTSEEVLHSRATHGKNLLTPPPHTPWWTLLLDKFKDPIIRLLIVAALVALVAGYFENSYTEGLGIIMAVLLATTIAFVNEYKAGKEFDILNQVNNETAVKVIRDGQPLEIPKQDVVVGDVVLLEQGDEVPADGLLLEALSLTVNESTLNGESMPSEKTAEPVETFLTAYSPNVLLRSTTITEGQGVMQVAAVGDATEIGKTARDATEISGEETPLNKQLNRLSKAIGKIGFTIAAGTFILLVLRDYLGGELQFTPTLDTFNRLLMYFMIAVTLIVVAVPEGLAMSVTLSLAYSMRRMTRTNNLVRKMHACETMGATTVVCTDKTGTLTQNKMRVQDYYMLQSVPQGLDPLVSRSVAVNTTSHLNASQAVGNPTEGALLQWLHENGVDYHEIRQQAVIIDRSLFSTEKKYMATHARFADREEYLFVKGAPEIILAQCTPESLPFNIQTQLQNYQERAMRTLAFAYRIPDPDEKGPLDDRLRHMTFLGFVAITDPVRPDVEKAVRECLNAGIKVKIITGDTSATAIEIARQIGLWKPTEKSDRHITGSEFAALSDDDAREAARRLKIISRARPGDKLRLVKLLQLNRHIVAVTGDGVNDAPALNYANVGLSMGSGTSVAKSASDIILLDDSFNSIVNAVRWGRSLYRNIQRFLQFQLTINVVALLVAFIGPFIGVQLPLTVTQMLWVNLIMDTFAALALATEPPDETLMQHRPRRAAAFIIPRRIAFTILSQAGLFLAVLLGLLAWFGHNENGLTPTELTIFFSVFVMLQFWNLFNARCAGTAHSAFHNLKESSMFLTIATLILVLQIAIVQFGGDLFRTTPLSFNHWLLIIGGTSFVLWTGEIRRMIKRNRHKRPSN